ncbi:hypothetical protein [Streptomyces sp. NPDC048603]|uniref:hypothetical protein n=1 Tax=Streptomyces sp. NPDC048603 TaxID=3365577 RepID=UPI00372456BE
MTEPTTPPPADPAAAGPTPEPAPGEAPAPSVAPVADLAVGPSAAPVPDSAAESTPEPAAAPAPVPAPEPEPASASEPASAAGPAGPYTAGPRPRRRLLAAGLRWAAAVLVFAAVGTAVAYGITERERTDLPGLRTEADGRWTYPEIRRPELPKGAPLPFAKDNLDGIHYAALQQLLLPAPAGSAPDPALKTEKDGTVSQDAFLREYAADHRELLKQGFRDEGLRQIAGRGWTMPDGTRTRVYLLRFQSSSFVDTFRGCTTYGLVPDGKPLLLGDEQWTVTKAGEGKRKGYAVAAGDGRTTLKVFQEKQPYGEEAMRAGCIQSGDIQAVLLQTRKGAEPAAVPFHQTVILQNQLLG